MRKDISSNFKNSLITTLKRFSFSILYSVILSVLIIMMISNDVEENQILIKLSNVIFSGLIYSILITIISESLKKNKSFIYNIILIVFMVLYYFFFPISGSDKYIYKTIIIDLAGILAIIFIPFLSKEKNQEFWFYNSKILFKLLITSVYVGVIIAGVSIAFGIITSLIGAEIKSETYFDFSIVTIGIFGAIYFLANFPRNFDENLDNFEYPKAIKILVFYILLPLTALYFLILYIYFIKIIIQWYIPSGSVSYMILIFSVLGILALMSIYPIKNSNKYKGISIFAKYFFWAILPLLILLFISIFIRIKDYGITENRYYVVLFAIWLLGISIYMIKTKLKNIKIIPISLFLIIVLTGFGPWSAFNVSKQSQLNKLDEILIENNIIPVDKSQNKVEINDSLYEIIYDISDYIISNHGIDILDKRYNIDLSSLDSDNFSMVDIFLDSLNISKTYYAVQHKKYFSIYNDNKIINIKDYDYYIDDFYSYSNSQINDTLNVKFDMDDFILNIKINKKKSLYNIKQQLINIIKHNYENDDLNSEDYEILLPQKDGLKIKLIISNFNGNFIDNKISDYSLTMGILIKNE